MSNKKNKHSCERYVLKRQLGLKTKLNTSNLCSSLKCVRQWNPKDTVDHQHHGGIFNFDFSEDGRIMLAACERRSLLVFDPHNGNIVGCRNDAHTDCVNCIRFLDSRTFATCSDDTMVCLWDIRFLKQKVRTLQGHTNWVKNIEYSRSEELLLSSGFDGSIYSWKINQFTDDSDTSQMEHVLHAGGLLRSKLSPDASKLVVSTISGYLMVIHDLDIATLFDDLKGFRPNLYHITQRTRSPIPEEYLMNHIFTRRRNRVELLADFPPQNDAKMISSLEVHPQGWCVLSRNTGGENSSEWTCVHDIQGVASDVQTVDLNTDTPFHGRHTWPYAPRSASPHFDDSIANAVGTDDNNSVSMNRNAVQPPTIIEVHADQLQRQVPGDSGIIHLQQQLTDSNSQIIGGNNSLNNREQGAERVIRFVYISNDTDDSDTSEDPINDNDDAETGNRNRGGRFPVVRLVRVPVSSAFLLRTLNNNGQVSRERIINYQPATVTSSSSSSRAKICVTKPRLTHYIEEANVGGGFIKEVAFNSDGRLISSPFAFGIRLLSFDSENNELCDCLPSQGSQHLFEVAANMSHTNYVVTTKFSPTDYLLVSGCLAGKVDFHQPVL